LKFEQFQNKEQLWNGVKKGEWKVAQCNWRVCLHPPVLLTLF
jgi:hypothetical protein